MPKNRYTLEDATIVPGCTTICNQLDKPALLNWAWKLGKEGKDWREERDGAGDRGTDVHDMIMRFWRGEEVAVIPESIQAKCFNNFLEWRMGHIVAPILIEQPLVSEKLRFGGQPDLFATINNIKTLLDIKTGKAIYEDVWYQLAGYELLLREHSYEPQQYAVLRLGQDGTTDYEGRQELEDEKVIFKALVEIYYRRKNGKGHNRRQ